MSYCRIGPDSDVHVYRTSDGAEDLWACQWSAVWDIRGPEPRLVADRAGTEMLAEASSAAAMLLHLETLRELGLRVPESALERLRDELVPIYVVDDGEGGRDSHGTFPEALAAYRSSKPGARIWRNDADDSERDHLVGLSREEISRVENPPARDEDPPRREP